MNIDKLIENIDFDKYYNPNFKWDDYALYSGRKDKTFICLLKNKNFLDAFKDKINWNLFFSFCDITDDILFNYNDSYMNIKVLWTFLDKIKINTKERLALFEKFYYKAVIAEINRLKTDSTLKKYCNEKTIYNLLFQLIIYKNKNNYKEILESVGLYNLCNESLIKNILMHGCPNDTFIKDNNLLNYYMFNILDFASNSRSCFTYEFYDNLFNKITTSFQKKHASKCIQAVLSHHKFNVDDKIKLIEKYKNYINMFKLSKTGPGVKLDEKIINKYHDVIDWYYIIRGRTKYKINVDFVKKYANNIFADKVRIKNVSALKFYRPDIYKNFLER